MTESNRRWLTRRALLQAGVAGVVGTPVLSAVTPAARALAPAVTAAVPPLSAQPPPAASPRALTVTTRDLMIGGEDHGDPQGFPVILLHGFPDDVRAWDDVVPLLVSEGYRAIVPYLRGHGSTRFHPGVFRSGEQAALGQDVVDLADALQLPRFALAGYDWGTRAACVTAARHPDRVRATVLTGGYAILDPFTMPAMMPPERERARWHFWYFITERGRAGLAANRRALCRYFWKTWSPGWTFSEDAFTRTATSFDNPDFVDVVVHVYRHWFQAADGDPRFAAAERELARRPSITVPTLLIAGDADAVAGPRTPDDATDRALFPRLLDRRTVKGAGHFLPREAPRPMAQAILDALTATSERRR